MTTQLPDRAEEARNSVPRTEATVTARLRYVSSMKSMLPSLAKAVASQHPTAAGVMRELERAARHLAPESALPSLAGPDGVIDFTNRRSMYSAGAFWRLVADGNDYSGHPGEWEVGPIGSLCEDDPFWLLALLSSTVEVTADADEEVRGVACHRYDALADLGYARERANGSVATPLHAGRQDLSRLPVQVWLEPAGRIREAVYWGEDDWQTRIQLSDYGAPDHLEVPGEDELAADET